MFNYWIDVYGSESFQVNTIFPPSIGMRVHTYDSEAETIVKIKIVEVFLQRL